MKKNAHSSESVSGFHKLLAASTHVKSFHVGSCSNGIPRSRTQIVWWKRFV